MARATLRATQCDWPAPHRRWQGNRGFARRRTCVRRTSKPEDWRRQGGKGPFPDGN